MAKKRTKPAVKPENPPPSIADVAQEAPVAPASQGKVNPFVKFTSQLVHRSKLKNAIYNPRLITDKAKQRLKQNIKRVGLIEPPVWNVRTSNIVGGHQRISVLDALMGTDDYMVPVAQVDLDLKTEKEQNIFLNNSDAQGGWDMEKLGALFKEDKFDFEATGWDTGEIYQMFGDSPIIAQPEALQASADRVRAAREQYDRTAEKMKDADDVDFYIVAVFQNTVDRKAFLDALGLEDNRFVDGRFLTAKLGGNGEGPDIASLTST